MPNSFDCESDRRVRAHQRLWADPAGELRASLRSLVAAETPEGQS